MASTFFFELEHCNKCLLIYFKKYLTEKLLL